MKSSRITQCIKRPETEWARYRSELKTVEKKYLLKLLIYRFKNRGSQKQDHKEKRTNSVRKFGISVFTVHFH